MSTLSTSVNVAKTTSEVLESLRNEAGVAAKHKLQCFNDLRKTLGQSPRVQHQLDDAHERYYEACRDLEEIEANMTRVRRK